MADSYHIIGDQVVPFHGGRKDTNTGAWRDATPLELQLQEQLAEAEREIEALRAEVERLQHGWMLALREVRTTNARAERLAEALRSITTLKETEFDDLYNAIGIANEALEQEK